MTDGRGVLREIAWRDLFPWLVLFRTFRLSIHPGVLTIALIAATLTPIGWRMGRVLFLIPANVVDVQLEKRTPLQIEQDKALVQNAQRLGRLPGQGRDFDRDVAHRVLNPWDAFSLHESRRQHSPILFVFDQFSWPLGLVYDARTSLGGVAYYLFGTLWSLAIWAFAGGLITRMAAVELGREEPATLRRAGKLAGRRWFEYFSAPLYPIIATFAIALVTMPLGWLIYSDVGLLVGSLLWIFALAGGAVTALLLLWLFIGWPLMWPAISSEENGDAFEAMSRSFAYAFQRPLNYLFYATVAVLFGYVCWSIVDFLCVLTIHATHWAVSWGSGYERLVEVFTPTVSPVEAPPAIPGVEEAVAHTVTLRERGAGIILGIEGLLLALSESFAYSFFWVSATAIYLLLRQDVDRGEFDEVWGDDEAPRFPVPQGEPTTSTVIEPTPTVAVDSATEADQHNQAE